MSQLTIEKQVQIAIAIGRYVRAESKFKECMAEHTQAQRTLAELLGSCGKMVAKVDYRYFLAETDSLGDLLDVEQIEVL
jgi:hypothetical protein